MTDDSASYVTNPEWHACRDKFVNPDGDNSGERVVGSIMAAVALWEIERNPSGYNPAHIAAILHAGTPS